MCWLWLIFAIFPLIIGDQCPPGSVVGLRAGDCYSYKPAAAWFDAEEECVTSGGHLAPVHDVFTNSFLAMLPKYLATNSGTFWLGGSFGITTSDRWSWWSDNSAFDFTHWASGFPFQNGTYCLTSFISDEYWRSADCRQQLPSVCKIPSGQSQPKRENLCPSGWTYYDFTGFCYKTFHNGYSTWFTANSTCVSNGANLASIHSYQEQQFIQDISGVGVPQQWTSGKYDAGVWIGMIGATADARTWAWTDGTPVDYTNWASTRPIDVQGGCTDYFPDYFAGWEDDIYYDRWANDANCGISLRAFICKKPASA